MFYRNKCHFLHSFCALSIRLINIVFDRKVSGWTCFFSLFLSRTSANHSYALAFRVILLYSTVSISNFSFVPYSSDASSIICGYDLVPSARQINRFHALISSHENTITIERPQCHYGSLLFSPLFSLSIFQSLLSFQLCTSRIIHHFCLLFILNAHSIVYQNRSCQIVINSGEP